MAGYPCGHPAKNFGQALQILEKQAFWNGHRARTSMKKLRSEKLRAEIPFPKIQKKIPAPIKMKSAFPAPFPAPPNTTPKTRNLMGMEGFPAERAKPTFFCASFFPFFTLSAPPFPRQFSSPKSSLSGTSDLLFLVEKRQPPGAGFWGRFWTRSPHRKKRKILFFFSGARKKVRKAARLGSGQEVCFCPSRPDPARDAREQDGTRTGRDGPHLGTWMGPKHRKTKHMANLDGTTSDPGWDLDGPRQGSGWHPPETVTDF